MKKELISTLCVFLTVTFIRGALGQDVNILILIPSNYGTNYHLDRDDFELFGWDVTLAGITETVAACPVYGGPLGAPALTVDILVSDITDVADYDIVAVMSGGGNDACADLLASQDALDLIGEAAQSGLVVAGFCPAVRVLAAAGVIDGRRVTGSPTYQNEYATAGATYVSGTTPVIDGNVVTSMMGDSFSWENCEALARVHEHLHGNLKPRGESERAAVLKKRDVFTHDDALWTKTFGGNSLEGGRSVCETGDGGFLVCGYTYSYGAGNCDLYLVKTDVEGNEEWSKTYGGSGWDYGYSACQTSDGGIIAVGYTTSYGAGARDVYVVKTDSEGNEEWSRTFGDEHMDVGKSVCETSDGGFVICGYTKSFESQNQDVYVIKMDADGGTVWTRTFTGYLSEFAHSVIETRDGGLLIAGSTISNIQGTFGDRDIYLIKTDANGDEEWTRTFHHYYFDSVNCVKETRDGGFILAGQTDILFGELLDVYLIKTDAQGNEEWRREFGEGTYYDYGRSVCETTDGGYLVCGATKSVETGNDVYLIKTDAEGNETWSKIFGGPGPDWGSSVCEASDGSYIITGHTGSFGAGRFDVWLLKISSLFPNCAAEPLTGHAPLEVNFQDLSLGSVVSWSWDFNNDGVVDSDEQSPSWIYEEPGIYTVTLEVSSGSLAETRVFEEYVHVFDGESALLFDGINSYALCSATPSLNITDAFTVEAWINPAGWGEFPGFGLGKVIEKRNVSLFLVDSYLTHNTQSLLLQLIHESYSASYSNTPEQSIALDEWQHIAVTYNGEDAVRMYINGTEQTVSHTIPPAGSIRDNSTNDFIIGNSEDLGWTFDGLIDEVRLWNVVRTPEEIQEYMNCFAYGNETGLVGSWRMNEGSGGALVDNSVKGNDGVVVDAMWRQGVHLDPITTDSDEDGVIDFEDNCPDEYNPEQMDVEGDGVGDVCDNCPDDYNSDQSDADRDGLGNVCDTCTDSDGDGYGDPGYPENVCAEDNCPGAYNPEQSAVERGDLDCNGEIDVLDVLAVVNHILASSLLVGGPLDRADCSGDGGVDILDALGIINVILGLGECALGTSKPVLTTEVMEFLKSLASYLPADDFGRVMYLIKEASVPAVYYLSQNYPNPFNPETTISFSISQASHVQLAIYNITGERVRKLVDVEKTAGYHSVIWNGTDERGQEVSSGVYFYSIKTEAFRETKSMVLLK
ncbi:MAG: DJ-1/PfpI family protein [Gemmatimonadota bacterium]|nr:MAG: DJ-1/PfpI family protein [Gemmatimonadota bacterium]